MGFVAGRFLLLRLRLLWFGVVCGWVVLSMVVLMIVFLGVFDDVLLRPAG